MTAEGYLFAAVGTVFAGMVSAAVLRFVTGFSSKHAVALGTIYYPTGILVFVAAASFMKGGLYAPGTDMLIALAVSMPLGVLFSELLKRKSDDPQTGGDGT